MKQGKNDARVNHKSSYVIGRIWKTGENDLDKLQVNDSGNNKGTNCLVNAYLSTKFCMIPST